MRIALLTDAWHPQVNGVVRTWDTIVTRLRQRGHVVLVIQPALFRTVPCPGYPAIRLAVRPRRKALRLLQEFQPQAIHIATEGPIGLVGRQFCQKHDRPFTTSYHTHFPHYLRVYYGIPEALTFRFMRWFHGRAQRTLVPTESVRDDLQARRFRNITMWKRGVDHQLFQPRQGVDLGYPRPVFLNAGRVSHEKNLSAFAELELPGTKVIIGDGPALPRLQRRYRDVICTGYLPDEDLARHYAGADVFVFPSLSDTFGNVMLEALACGTPVAAFRVCGPQDLVQDGVTGRLDADLGAAAVEALTLDRGVCRTSTESWCWNRATDVLEEALTPF